MLAAILLALTSSGFAQVDADVVLRNATLHVGDGKPGEVGDLAIKADRIVAVGKFKVNGSPKSLDCTGLVISPGFIDLHTHSDYPLQDKATKSNKNYLMQGVTTVVTGNCGAGPVDAAGYFAKMEKQGIGSNVIHQVPHNSVREKVMGNKNRDPSDDELHKMEALVDKGMSDGAWGMATGLIYTPGTYAKTDELISLSKVVAKHGGFYASHIRNEGAEIITAIEEILTIARRAGLRVHISHIKVSGRGLLGKSGDVIARIRQAREEGVDVTADQYPYIASSTSLAAMVIPTKYREGTAKEFLARLDDPELGPKIRKAIESQIDGRKGGKSLKIARYAPKVAWQGKDLATIAEMEKKSMVDVVIEAQRNGGAAVVSFGMNEEDVRLFMKESYVATASDGAAMVPGQSVPHPRSYGTFPRKVGRYSLEDQIITLEHAIRSCSGLPADILRLPERGYLKVGYFADLVVFDPKTFRDAATYDVPHQYAVGIRYLFVNGELAVDQGQYNDKLAGRVIRHREKSK